MRKCKIDFGTINLYGTGKRYKASVEMELGEEEKGPEFSCCAYIKTANGRGWNTGGQCLDEINKHRKELRDIKLWDTVYRLWKTYHLNDMHAGTKEQEAEVNEYVKNTTVKQYEQYEDVCNHLKDVGLYEVQVNGQPYKYGHGWLYWEIPEDDLNLIKSIITVYE